MKISHSYHMDGVIIIRSSCNILCDGVNSVEKNRLTMASSFQSDFDLTFQFETEC